VPAPAGRLVAGLCLLVLLAEVVAVVALSRSDQLRPRQVPVLVVGPAVVAQQLAAEADALPDEPFRADWLDDGVAAREAVRDGEAVAALLVRLAGTEDLLVVHAQGDATLNDAVADRVAALEAARDRTVKVTEVTRPDRVDAGHSTGAQEVRRMVLLCVALGGGFVLVVSFARGPVAATRRLGVVRVVGLACVAILGATLLQLIPATALAGEPVHVLAIAAAHIFAIGLLALAFEALAGFVGLALAVLTHLVLALPLIAGVSRHLLPAPWGSVWHWLPTGAAQEALAHVSYLDPGAAVRPALALLAAALVSIVVLLAARTLRGQAAAPGAPAPIRHWRLRVLGLVAPLALALGVGIWLVPTESVEARTVPRTASETACIQDLPAPTSVGELNRRIAQTQGADAFLGADVGASVRLQDGRVLLVFGDTLRSAAFAGPSMARNSMMLWDPDCVSVVLPPGGGALIPDRGDGVGYWPMSLAVAQQPGYDLVLVSAQRVETTGGGSFDFANVGSALAVFVVPAGGTPQLVALQDVGPDSADTGRPHWGAALAVDPAEGWLYLYGTAHPGTEGVFGFSLQVARVRPFDVLDTRAWRYWDGSAWQADPERAAELIPAEGGVSQTLSVVEQDGTWFALSKLGGDLSDDIGFWTAPSPTGPFTPTAPIASAPVEPGSGNVTYMPLAHPELMARPGSMVISYSRNNLDFDAVVADPSLYRPRFLRVPLPIP